MSGLKHLKDIRGYWHCRQATADVVRLFSGELTLRDEARLIGWRNNAPEYQASLLGTAHLLADLEVLADDPELLALVETPDKYSGALQAPQPLTRKSVWPKLAVAASLVLGLVLGGLLLWWPPAETHRLQLYVTRTGEQKTVTLEDRSVLTLNTATQLLVDMTDTARRVVLERGEAYFAVAPDPQRPFTVDLGSRTVAVLGTEFNIRRSPEKFILAVINGAVAILREGESGSASAPELAPPQGEVLRIAEPSQRRLQAGMVVEFAVSKQELTAYRAEDIGQLQSWRQGLISFNADPLSLVVRELNRYSAKKILIEDASIMDLRIYATARVNDINSVLIGLEQSLPIKVVSYVDRIVIVAK